MSPLLDDLVKRLLATQLDDGYTGTYLPDITFMRRPENGKIYNDVADDLQYESSVGGERPKRGYGKTVRLYLVCCAYPHKLPKDNL